jgi:Tol biopolymer transport system component
LEPRHWLRSSPDGGWIVFLARDDEGVVQAYLVSPNGGPVLQATSEPTSIESCVRWSPDGARLLYVSGASIRVSGARPDLASFGRSVALTDPSDSPPTSPVWSRDGRLIAFNRSIAAGSSPVQHIFVVDVPAGP